MWPAMEPIRHTLTARFKNIRMYREDLDQLVAGFHNTCATVTISDNDNRYDSLEEMRQKGQPKIRAFDIRGENPGVHFLFNQTGVAQSSYPPFQYVFNELRNRGDFGRR